MNRLEPGDVLRIETTIRDITGALADPGGLVFTINPPNATPIAYVYPTNIEIVRSGLGTYYVDWPVTAAGTHRYGFASTGANAAVEDGSFVAGSRRVVPATP